MYNNINSVLYVRTTTPGVRSETCDQNVDSYVTRAFRNICYITSRTVNSIQELRLDYNAVNNFNPVGTGLKKGKW